MNDTLSWLKKEGNIMVTFDRIKLNFVFYMKHCQLKLSADRRKIITWL